MWFQKGIKERNQLGTPAMKNRQNEKSQTDIIWKQKDVKGCYSYASALETFVFYISLQAAEASEVTQNSCEEVWVCRGWRIAL